MEPSSPIVILRCGHPVCTEHFLSLGGLLSLAELADTLGICPRMTVSNAPATEEGLAISGYEPFVQAEDAVLLAVAPTEGYFGRLSNDFAGLGGDETYLRTRLEGGYYYPLDREHEWVLSTRAGTGYIFGIGDDTRISQRFMVAWMKVLVIMILVQQITMALALFQWNVKIVVIFLMVLGRMSILAV